MKNNISQLITVITRDGIAEALPYGSTVIALGTFDGVHIAHQRLLHEARQLKREGKFDAVGAWCFDETPASLIRGDKVMTLTSRDEKIRLLFENGVDFVATASFYDFRNMQAEDFARHILYDSLACRATVCGFNHRFGCGGHGDPDLLKSIFGDKYAMTVPKVMLDGETVSSSAIREHLKNGDTDIANKMLGRCISMTSTVNEGKKLGRILGFPTANQSLPQNFTDLSNGVYATRCHFEGEQSYIGVSNVGIRPSISSGDDHTKNCETYIIGFNGELYGKSMTVEFCSFLRKERKFLTLEELTNAIEADKQAAVKYFQKV